MKYKPVTCTEQYHDNEAVEYFCQQCEKCICLKCGQTTHNLHNKMVIQQAADDEKLQMTQVFHQANMRLANIETKMKEQIELMAKSREKISAAEKKVTETVEEIIRIAREHETAIKTKLAEIKEAQERKHETKMKKFQDLAAEIKSSVQHGEDIVQRNIAPQILQAGHAVVYRCNKLFKSPEINIYNPQQIRYYVDEETMKAVSRLVPGRVAFVTDPRHQYKALHSLGSPGKGPGKFDSPWSIAVSERTGKIAVADHGNKRVHLFDSKFKYLTAIEGKRPGETVKNVLSVAFTASDDVIVILGQTFTTHQMLLFTEHGQFIKHISQHLINPRCVSVRTDGHLIVSDWGDKSVKVLSPDGTELLQSFRALASVEFPRLAVYHQDMFFVSYGVDHCVKVFSEDGVFLYDIGSGGSGDGQLKEPGGLAIDKFNNLIVCDSGNSRLQVFSLDGKFVNSVTEGMDSPCSVAVTKDGNLLVCDRRKQCIHVFQ